MRIYLMRHAAAVPRGTPGYSKDAQRPLTGEGLLQSRGVARGLKRLKIPVDLVLTSPLLRAAQTAEQVAKEMGKGLRVRECPELQPDQPVQRASQALKEAEGAQHVLLVGHEPHLSMWMGEMVSPRGRARCLMKKGGVACVELDEVPPSPGGGTLRWLMSPKHLTRIGK